MFFKICLDNYFFVFNNLIIIVLVVRVVLSYLMMLFLDCQVSYMIICVVVKINFLVSLFVLVAFNVSNCCCKVKGCPVNLVKYVWKCNCTFGEWSMLPSFSQQY